MTREHAADPDVPVLEMVRPMIGFPDHRRFALTRLDEAGALCALQSLDEPGLSFVVVPPDAFFEDYRPEVDDAVGADLGIESTGDLLTLVVLTLGESLAETTANLLAPVLVNHRTRRGGQVLLDDPDLPIRAPVAP
ncbi:MAG TPA: flagellar assembly protein FliW [Nocardioidaceae bacterium]|nr:flagellar assembly protein FliW [Nocardioidaceae bacterium]